MAIKKVLNKASTTTKNNRAASTSPSGDKIGDEQQQKDQQRQQQRQQEQESSTSNTNHSSSSASASHLPHRATHHHRTHVVWSAADTHGVTLHKVSDADRRPLKSCMKPGVETIEDSLREADENDRKRKEQSKSRKGLFPSGLSRRFLSRREKRGNSSTKNNNLTTTDEDGDGSNNRGSLITGGGLSRRFSPIARRLSTQQQKQPQQQQSKPKPNTVSFTTLHFRYYDLQATDNPGVSKGPAIGIGWTYDQDPNTTPVDTHEQYRTNVEPRRQLKEIKLSRTERERRLLNSGVTQRELDKMRKQINSAKGRRKKTLEGASNFKRDERRERVLRKLKLVLGMRKKYEEEEEELWDKAQERGDVVLTSSSGNGAEDAEDPADGPVDSGSGHQGVSAAY